MTATTAPTRLPYDSYLRHLRRESTRFADVLELADPGGPVPTCPEWRVGDLVHHLVCVQSFWAAVVRGAVVEDADAERIREPERASDLASQLGQLRAASLRLEKALEQTPPTAAAWTWSSDRTVGFIYRRQALEALVHRLDAEIAVGARTPCDAALAADGVDEGLRIMIGGCPPWGTITADPTRGVLVETTDTAQRWLVRPARFTGTDPDGQLHDEADIAIDDSGQAEPDARIAGTAEDLLCWIWGRPTTGEIARSGDEAALEAVTTLVGRPIN